MVGFAGLFAGPEIDDPVGVDLAAELPVQGPAHQVHHRGQAHAMLAGTAMPPPPLDEFFPAFGRAPTAQEYLR